MHGHHHYQYHHNHPSAAAASSMVSAPAIGAYGSGYNVAAGPGLAGILQQQQQSVVQYPQYGMGYHGPDHSLSAAAEPHSQPHFGYGTGANFNTAYGIGNSASPTAGAPYLGNMGPRPGAASLPINTPAVPTSIGANPYLTQGHYRYYYSDSGTGSLSMSSSSPTSTTNYQQGYTSTYTPSMYSLTTVPFPPAANLQQPHEVAATTTETNGYDDNMDNSRVNENGAPPRPQPAPASLNPFESFRNG
jgi:hypothetical protein